MMSIYQVIYEQQPTFNMLSTNAQFSIIENKYNVTYIKDYFDQFFLIEAKLNKYEKDFDLYN